MECCLKNKARPYSAFFVEPHELSVPTQTCFWHRLSGPVYSGILVGLALNQRPTTNIRSNNYAGNSGFGHD